MSPPMKLVVNGESRELACRTVAELVRELGLEGRPLAVEVNRQVVPKSRHSETQLQEGDRIEVVHFVGGG